MARTAPADDRRHELRRGVGQRRGDHRSRPRRWPRTRTFSEDPTVADATRRTPRSSTPRDKTHGGSIGFPAGSTFKLFTLIDWLEKGHSLNETLNGVNRVFPQMKNSLRRRLGQHRRTKIDNFNNARRLRRHADAVHDGLAQHGLPRDGREARPLRHQRRSRRMGVKTGDGNTGDAVSIPTIVASDVLGSDERLTARHGRRLRDGRQQRHLLPAARRSTGSPTPTASEFAPQSDLHPGARPRDRRHRRLRAAGRHDAAAAPEQRRTRTTARR